MGSVLQDKKQAFLDELNERLPKGVMAVYKEAQMGKNILNVIIHSGGNVLQLFGLIEDPDETVWWFKNTTGGFY